MRSTFRVLTAAAIVASVLMIGPYAGGQEATPGVDVAADSNLAVTVNGTYQPLAGDFDGDGDDDIFWYAPGTAADFMWQSNGDGTFVGRSGPVVNGTYQARVGDFDRDGHDDIFWYQSGDGYEYVWWSITGPFGSFHSEAYLGFADGMTPFLGDFNGDDSVDFFLYTPGLGQDWIWTFAGGDGAHPVSDDASAGTSRPVVGDADDDGDDDILWYASGAGQDYTWQMDGLTSWTEQATDDFQNLTQVPLGGEFDGTFSDVMLYGPGSQADMFAIRTAAGGAFANQDTAVNGTYSRAFTGDFTGEGLSDIFWYRPGTGQDFLWLFS